MFDKYVPDMYVKNIFTINYDKLKSLGIKCLLFDLDNTLSPIDLSHPIKQVKNLINNLKNMGFKVMIISNSGKSRVEPFKNELGIDAAINSLKPKSTKFLKIMSKYKFNCDEIAMIGDQLMTDVYGANKLGITSILVNPMGEKDFFVSAFNRAREKHIFKKLTQKDLLKRGRYYD